MRISNWCILFMSLFLGVVLLPDFKEQYARNAQHTMEMYHRNIDRAAEDALADQVKEEYIDGNLLLDEKKITDTFLKQVYLDFDIVTEAEKKAAADCFLLQKLVNEKGEMTEEEQNRVAEEMEALLAQNTKLRHTTYAMLFPRAKGESWSNPVDKKSFYAFFELPDTENYAWSRLFGTDKVRYAFSGAKVRKMTEKTE